MTNQDTKESIRRVFPELLNLIKHGQFDRDDIEFLNGFSIRFLDMTQKLKEKAKLNDQEKEVLPSVRSTD